MTTLAGVAALDANRFEPFRLLPQPTSLAEWEKWCGFTMEDYYGPEQANPSERMIRHAALDRARELVREVVKQCSLFGELATASGSLRRILTDPNEPRVFRPPYRQAFEGLQRALGVLSAPAPKPWWLTLAYPEGDYYCGLTEPAAVASIADDLAACRFVEQAIPMLRSSCGNPAYADDLERLCELVARAKSADAWLLGIESGS